MIFLQYCYEIDINLDENSIQIFSNNTIYGYIINEEILAIKVDGYQNLFCLFGKDDNTSELTSDFALSFAQNMHSLIKETHKIIENIDDRYIKSCVHFNSTNKQFIKSNYTTVIDSFPLYLYQDFRENVYYVVADNDTIYSLNNERVAKSVFKKLKEILLSCIRRNW